MINFSPWDAAMQRALALAARGRAVDPNPRVGCVILAGSDFTIASETQAPTQASAHDHASSVTEAGTSAGTAERTSLGLRSIPGRTLGEGFHAGAGTPHAEVLALRDAAGRGIDVRGATAVVTLEPCNHSGRTGPCAQALIEAGIARVVIAQSDPTQLAAGGARRLAAAGIEVVTGVLEEQAIDLNPWFTWSAARGRPFVTCKLAGTLDARVAAVDGTSQWITGPDARADVHRGRATAGAVVVGTGTALADDPRLTVRDENGAPMPSQPWRVVVGHRELPPQAAVCRSVEGAEPALLLQTHDPALVLTELWARGVQHVWLEGGPTLAAAFLRAGLVDRLITYLAPALLGAGPALVGSLGIATLTDLERWRFTDITRLGDDVRITAEPMPATATPPLTQGPVGPTEPLPGKEG